MTEEERLEEIDRLKSQLHLALMRDESVVALRTIENEIRELEQAEITKEVE